MKTTSFWGTTLSAVRTLSYRNVVKACMVLCLLSFVGKMSAQEYREKGLLSRLNSEIGFSMLGHDLGSASPFTGRFEESKGRYAINAQLLYRYESGEGIGLEFFGAPRTLYLTPMTTDSYRHLDYIGLAFARELRLPRDRWSLRTSLSIGYAHVDHMLKNWGDGKTSNVSANGLGATIRLTSTYQVLPKLAIGFQLSLAAIHFGEWNPSEDMKIHCLYNGGLFGEKASSVLMPGVGIVLTNPLGR